MHKLWTSYVSACHAFDAEPSRTRLERAIKRWTDYLRPTGMTAAEKAETIAKKRALMEDKLRFYEALMR